MEELDALNMLLRLIGSSPVTKMDTLHPDAANAKITLDRIRKQAQRRGWWFNSEYGLTLTPDDDGKISIPSTYSSVIFRDQCIVKRNRKVYNQCTQTFTFTASVYAARAIRILSWEEMPDVVQEYAAYFAASQFIRDELEDPTKEASLLDSSKQAYLEMKKQDLAEGQYNMFTTPRIQRARSGVRPYSRGSVRFFGSPDA